MRKTGKMVTREKKFVPLAVTEGCVSQHDKNTDLEQIF
jgi:hypothetical protein